MANKITRIEKEFLKILESFMHDRAYVFPKKCEQFQELFRLAEIHHVGAAVFEQIRQDEVWNQGANLELQQHLKKRAIYTVMTQAQRTAAFLNLYRVLSEAGIRPLIVKGLICRNLYSKPDYRISSDEDILLKREDFERCDQILLQNGFGREELDLAHLPYEIPYLNQRTGVYIELHFTLFPEKSEEYGFLNQEFGQAFDHAISETIQGVEVWTLSPTEHMLYLICHSFKHFLHSGFGVRQVCDMVMMAEHYGEQIDWKYIGRRLKSWQMLSFWAGLAEIGRTYLGFDWQKAHYDTRLQKADVGCEELLVDLLQSGVYGNSSMERKHSSNITLAAMKTGKKNTWRALRTSIFPSMEYMKGRYRWLRRCPFLLPVAWLVRVYSYMVRKEREDEKQLSGLKIGMERVELLRKYRIIK